jgi:xylulokinase
VACQLIKKVLQDAKVHSRDVKGVAVSSALPSMVLVDRNNLPIHNAYNLMDKRATAQVEWLKKEIGEERIFQSSGYRLEDHPLLVNLLWEKQNRSDTFDSIAKVLTIDSYIVAKLTGETTTHFSAAAFYGVAYNLRKRNFDQALLDELDIKPTLLPDLYNCDDIVGQVTHEAARACGLQAGTPVAAGQVDCNAAWLGAGAISAGDF